MKREDYIHLSPAKRSLNLPPRYRLPGEMRVNWVFLGVCGAGIAFWGVVIWWWLA